MQIKINYDEAVANIKKILDNNEDITISRTIIKDTQKEEINRLNYRVCKLEKELQTLKNNLYEVFFNEDLTSKK